MSNDDDLIQEFQTQLRESIEDSAARQADWTAFHVRLANAVASRLDELRRRASGGYQATAAAGAAWWDYAARAALAGVPLGLAAALLLLSYLRSGNERAGETPSAVAPAVIASGSADSARDAFESVLTGAVAPRAVMATLIPVPPAAFLADSVRRSTK